MSHNYSDREMNEFKIVFRPFSTQVLHIVILPIFFYAFNLAYHPFRVDQFLTMGRLNYVFHLTMLACILLVCVAISRVSLHFIKDLTSEHGTYEFSLSTYIAWCFLEALFASLFMGLYIWLFKKSGPVYFNMVLKSLQLLAFSCVYPYVILELALTSYSRGHRKMDPKEDEMLRFHDDKNNLKFVIAAKSILYITAEENYIRVWYLDGTRERDYVIRNTMKSIVELCAEGGLVRCHRSYYINPRHVKVLGKDGDGMLHAIMDDTKASSIPVSKRYYEELLALI